MYQWRLEVSVILLDTKDSERNRTSSALIYFNYIFVEILASYIV